MIDTKCAIEMIDRFVICERWCAKYGTPECPTSAECLSTDNKPYFKAKRAGNTLLAKWCRKRDIKRICKANNYNCTECIYHEHLYDGLRYIGTACRLEDEDTKR